MDAKTIMKYIKKFENITTSGTLKDPYFKKDMWVINITSKSDQEDSEIEKFEKNLLTKTRSLMKIFKEHDINYKLVYYEMITKNSYGGYYGVYFMLDKTNFKKLENKIILPHNLTISKVPENFIYPDDFEDNIIISINELKKILEIRKLTKQFNI